MLKGFISLLMVGAAYSGFLIGSHMVEVEQNGSNMQKLFSEFKMQKLLSVKDLKSEVLDKQFNTLYAPIKNANKINFTKKYVVNDVKKLFKSVKDGKKVKGKVNLKKVAKVIIEKESSGDKYAVNHLEYIGWFQFGVQSLETLGYLKKGEYKRMKKLKVGQKTFLKDYAKWTKKYSYSKFVENEQYNAFYANCNRNIKQLKKHGYITKKTSAKEIHGMLFAAHLKGLGATKKWLSGRLAKNDYCDANGVSIEKYYKIGINI